MKQVACYLIFGLMAFLLSGGCSRDTGENAEGEVLVNLNINVALSDVARPIARGVVEDAKPKNEDEMMQKLRVIVVRENGVVEINDFINFSSSAVMSVVSGKFKVVSGEWKQIYLFVNEDNESIQVSQGDSNETLALSDFLDGIMVGETFPAEVISNLTVRVETPSGQLSGALPMNERHQVYVSRQENNECQLFVTRAAVKFTFRITNETSTMRELTGLVIKNMANKEYYLPRNAKYEEETIGEEGDNYSVLAIKSYNVPPFSGVYDYKHEGVDVILPANNGFKELEPIYLLEGKPDGEYLVGITVNGVSWERKLGNLPHGLPRNTHVVVNITIKNDDKFELEWVVDVEPYREKELKPDFGL
ncbi:hypothetical protein [Butyricimonas synergistica]|uniref:hypothetical protein n=1 Tax=Butyricimonas synergistica TaxID=544644 RepID=UPI0004772125|nr:hypothetical protein [Butyricimonas synergistica]